MLNKIECHSYSWGEGGRGVWSEVMTLRIELLLIWLKRKFGAKFISWPGPLALISSIRHDINKRIGEGDLMNVTLIII